MARSHALIDFFPVFCYTHSMSKSVTSNSVTHWAQTAYPYIESEELQALLPKAPIATTPVYFVAGLAIKATGSLKVQARFEKTEQVRLLCEKKGYHHLIVPMACIYRDWIIEKQLPIELHHGGPHSGTKRQMGLYVENRDRFTRAAQDFTALLCQVRIDDFIGHTFFDPWGKFSKSLPAKFYNACLYLEGDQGKVGLVDVEDLQEYANARMGCLDAIRFFPLHFEEILAVAKQFDPEIEMYREDLERERDETLKRVKIVYIDHANYLKAKNITLDNPLDLVAFSPERRAQIATTMTSLLPEQTEEALTHIYNFLRERLKEEIISDLKSQRDDLLAEAIVSLPLPCLSVIKEYANDTHIEVASTVQLVSYRSLQFGPSHASYKQLINAFTAKVHLNNSAATETIKKIFTELAKGGEIAYYNPKFGFNGATQCTFI